MCGYVHLNMVNCRVLKMLSELLELELQVVASCQMQVLQTELGDSTKSSLNSQLLSHCFSYCSPATFQTELRKNMDDEQEWMMYFTLRNSNQTAAASCICL